MPEFGLMTPRDEVFPELSPQVTAALADRLITFDTAHSATSSVSSSRHHWLQTWLTAAAVLLLSVLGAGWWIIGSASPAQAWSAVPIDLTAQQTAAAVRTCQRGGASQSVAGAVEGRGRSVYVLFTDSTQCLLLTGADAAAITPPTFTPHPGEVTGLDVNLLWTGPLSATHPAAITPEPGQRSALVGQVGADVRSVRINLADGSSLTATVSNGWVIAWWPGTAAATGLAAPTPTATANTRSLSSRGLGERRSRTDLRTTSSGRLPAGASSEVAPNRLAQLGRARPFEATGSIRAGRVNPPACPASQLRSGSMERPGS